MREEDAPALFSVLGDDVAMRFWHRSPLPRLATLQAQMADELAAMADGSFHCWTVLKDADAIGSVDLKPFADQAWIGIAMRRDMWRKGLGREALGAVIAASFGPIGLSRLAARVQEANLAARRLLEASGFQAEGAAAPISRDGETLACLRYGLMRSRSQRRKWSG